YYKLLGDIQAYGGNADLFYSFIADRVLETQQIILDALNGKEIDDLDDIGKEIHLFKKHLAAKQVVGYVKKSNKVIHDLYFGCIKRLFLKIEEKHTAFDELFFENEYRKSINNSHPKKYSDNFL